MHLAHRWAREWAGPRDDAPSASQSCRQDTTTDWKRASTAASLSSTYITPFPGSTRSVPCERMLVSLRASRESVGVPHGGMTAEARPRFAPLPGRMVG